MLIASEKIFDYFKVFFFHIYNINILLSIQKKNWKQAMKKIWILKKIIMKQKIFQTFTQMFKEVNQIYFIRI